jgi:plastocyanin
MTTTLGIRHKWQGIAILAVLVLFGLALMGLRGEIASAGDTAQASRTAAVDIKGFDFRPGTLKIAKGSTVAFSNSSGVTHTATRAGSFDTGNIKPGKSILVRFKQKGSFAYHCTIHPFMHGKIVVE